ncbi:MAG: aspartate kinase, partial [Firmicutes bacterium]|nr:aspartate kinase [Bacillota bacterium]
MKIIVQKFGGTSVATPEKRTKLVAQVKRARKQGYASVVVISAMGRRGEPYATDTLKALAEEIYPAIALREMDLLMSCGELISAVVTVATLNSHGIKARAMTGSQAGLVTDGTYSEAEVIDCNPQRVQKCLENGEVVVVAGFQGATADGEINTLGRGGSDTTAVILGAALNAELVEIYTDVNGIMTADPKVLQEAQIIEHLTYSEVCQMAYEGAKVIHPAAVEVAMQNNVTIVIKNSAGPNSGTMITGESRIGHKTFSARHRCVVTGIAHTTDIAQVQVEFEKSDAEKELLVFERIAEAGINVDLINIFPLLKVFTVKEELVPKVKKELEKLGVRFRIRKGCAKVSVIGAG